MAQLVRAPARRAGDLGSNLGAGKNFSLKLLRKDMIGRKELSKIKTRAVLASYPVG